MKKYQTATTEQKAGQVDANGKPLSPNPPDDSGKWQLIGLHAFMRHTSESDRISLFAATTEWFIHFYWQRAIVEPTATVRPPPTPMPGSGQMAMKMKSLEALYKLLGSCMSRDPHVRAIAQVHAARSDFDLPTCLAEMVHCLTAEKERLAMDLTTAKIDQIESRMAARKAGLRRPTEYTQEIGGYDAEDAPSVNDQYTNEAIAQGR